MIEHLKVRDNIMEGLKQGIEQGIKQGIEQGIKQGIKQGSQQQAVKDARSFYANGVSVELIAKSLKMPVEQVQQIVKDVIR